MELSTPFYRLSTLIFMPQREDVDVDEVPSATVRGFFEGFTFLPITDYMAGL